MWDDSNPGHRHSWKLFALALLVSTGAHFIIVEVVPGFGTAPESITLDVIMMSKPAIDPPARQGTRAVVQQRAAPEITAPAPSHTPPSGEILPIPQARAGKPAPPESPDDLTVPLLTAPENNSEQNKPARALLSPELLDAQMKAATGSYLEEQTQAACSSLIRKHTLAECPATIGGNAAHAVNNPETTILPPLVPEEHPLTDEELERRASIKGIQLFNFKFRQRRRRNQIVG